MNKMTGALNQVSCIEQDLQRGKRALSDAESRNHVLQQALVEAQRQRKEVEEYCGHLYTGWKVFDAIHTIELVIPTVLSYE
jgi:hypothetical protein